MATSLRRGSFSPSLDPFGSSRGGLGRYNVSGESITSLAQQELYAVSVAWANGTATDEDYIAAIERIIDLTAPATSERTRYENQLNDAKYAIGRNKLVRDVNNATTTSTRQSALRALLTYEQGHLGTMTATNSEAYREQQDRVAGVRSDLRRERYTDAVKRYNSGKLSTAGLISIVSGLAEESGNDPDSDDWAETLMDLRDRQRDESITQQYQDYQHNRATGTSLLAAIDAQLAQLEPGSPKYTELLRQREDLAESIRRETASKKDAEMYGRFQRGEISNADWLKYLTQRYEQAPEGTTERIEAGNRLKEYVFSVSEDKLRYDLEVGKPGAREQLIALYRVYRDGANVVRGSQEWMALDLAIRRLQGGGSVGGGGGGGGGGKGYSTGGKLIVPLAQLEDIMLAQEFNGQKVPADFKRLFSLDPTDAEDAKWWDNNFRSMRDSLADGRSTWIYYDQRGAAHELRFTPSVMSQMAELNLAYQQYALAEADNPKEVQARVGKIISARQALQTVGGTLTMDIIRSVFEDLDRAKKIALAGGRLGEYIELTEQQQDFLQESLWIPAGAPLDTALSQNQYLSDAQLRTVQDLIFGVTPYAPGVNEQGDRLLSLAGTPALRQNRQNGEWELDPQYAYLTQNNEGTVEVVLNDGGLVEAPDGTLVPAYQTAAVQARVSVFGQPTVVWQPVDDGGTGLTVWSDQAVTPIAGPRAGSVAGGGVSSRPPSFEPSWGQLADSKTGEKAKLPVKTMTTYERANGLPTAVHWVSFDGATWLRMPTSGALSPRLVVPAGYKWTSTNGGTWTKDGQEVSATEVLAAAKWWGGGRGQTGLGTPGVRLTMRTTAMQSTDGSIIGYHPLDTRPDWVIDAEEIDRLRNRNRDRLAMAERIRELGLDPERQQDVPIRKPREVPSYERGPSPEVSRMEADLRRRVEEGDIMPAGMRWLWQRQQATLPAGAQLLRTGERPDIRFRLPATQIASLPKPVLATIEQAARPAIITLAPPTLSAEIRNPAGVPAPKRPPLPAPKPPPPPPALKAEEKLPPIKPSKQTGDQYTAPAPPRQQGRPRGMTPE